MITVAPESNSRLRTPRGADRLGISTGSATELVDRFERAGHLERHRDTADRRRILLHASLDAVQSVLGELAPLFGLLDQLAEEFTPAEQEAIVRHLRTAASRMRGFIRDPPRGTPEP